MSTRLINLNDVKMTPSCIFSMYGKERSFMIYIGNLNRIRIKLPDHHLLLSSLPFELGNKFKRIRS